MKMQIAKTDLTQFWTDLVDSKPNRFDRKHHDERYNIEYGLQKSADGGCEFYVKDAVTKADLTPNFIQSGSAGVFQKVFNLLRCLRPGGEPKKPGRQEDIPNGVEQCRFYCVDPANPMSLLIRPSLPIVAANSNSLRFKWTAYPNFAPFEPSGHFLLMPCGDFPPLPHFPQLLSPELLQDFISLCRCSTDMVLFFNSRHAGATADHFHIQAVCHPEGSKLPLEDAATIKLDKPYSGSVGLVGSDYPVNALVFNSSATVEIITNAVIALQSKLVPFNLIFIRGRFFLVPRDLHNEIVREFSSVLASMEICGKFILSDEQIFQRATESMVSTALGRIRLSSDEILALSPYLK